MRRRLGQKLFEVFEKIRGGFEQMCDLAVNLLDRFRLALISLKNLEKLLVDIRMSSETVLTWSIRGQLVHNETIETYPDSASAESQPGHVQRTPLTLILFT